MTTHDDYLVAAAIGEWCENGWAETPAHPACNYTGGHFCARPANHKGRCRCTCEATTTVKREDR